jgi:cystathionine beta-lyase
LSENLPEVKVRKPEGTYLLWLDFNYYDFTDRELNDIIVHDAKLWLDRGNIFGRVGSGFQRINVACPRKTLEDALERLVNTFKICEQKRKIS